MTVEILVNSSATPYLKILYPIRTWASHHAWAPSPHKPKSGAGSNVEKVQNAALEELRA